MSAEQYEMKSKLRYDEDLTITRIKEDTLESAISSPEKSGIKIVDQQQKSASKTMSNSPLKSPLKQSNGGALFKIRPNTRFQKPQKGIFNYNSNVT